ncbi:hypothetical protein PHMEG_0008692 [Phytophthora megakarya]|uniref:Uncharacterized protein n=1 Tax=Phytophthora megakarya TaxID=4795 RepID=A0A225WIH5_9STRA|nr:hypothetical protein PHMEG_0008692 [Phytophthora megakarya]
MKLEDNLSRAVEREQIRKTRLKIRKEMADQVSSCAIYKCMHEMNGKRFLISLYIRNARGYDLEGLRIVAYDPTSSASFTMVMTFREFNSLGYGRTSDGLGSFCRWLCLLYEKRRRQFRLVWSGTSCPPPLRVRVHDQALICIHKEGVKIKHLLSDRYYLVAVYIRADNPSIVRFVVSSWHGEEFLQTEHAVVAPHMAVGSDLDVHTPIDNAGQRIYSGEVTVNRARYSVHLYDTNETEYTVELIPKLRKGETVQTTLLQVDNKLKLFKREVNPYNVHLSTSNFADLMSLTRFVQTQPRESVKEFPEDIDNDHGCYFQWKAIISPKWAGKLAIYVRVLRLAKYACKIGGVFCFVAVFVVQQKTEFRAHLLLEITWLVPTLSSSCSLGGVATRQSVRIPLSDYIRCANVFRRVTVGSIFSSAPLTFSMSCSNCVMIQHRRLCAIKELIVHVGDIAPVSLEFIYHGYCDVCATLAPPIILVLGSVLSHTTMMWLQPRLEYYFASFDCNKIDFTSINVEAEGPSIAEENANVREMFLQTLARDRVAVLFNADSGITVYSANLFVHELHWWMYPDRNDLPCNVAYVVDNQNDNHYEKSQSGGYRDSDLREALQALTHTAAQIAEFDPAQLEDENADESARASAFDAYLVAEAVLVEAIQVLLHPDYAWQKPRKIVSASSWSSACRFLLDPVTLRANLQQFDALRLSEATWAVLDAYFTHPKWPHDYPNVRPCFYGLLAFMMHVHHVRQILVVKSGSLQILLKKCPVTEGETTGEHEHLAKSTGVMDCSRHGLHTIAGHHGNVSLHEFSE